MENLVELAIRVVVWLIGVGILLTVAFWAMNNLGLLIILLITLGTIAFFYKSSSDKVLDSDNKNYEYDIDSADMINKALSYLIEDDINSIVNFTDIDYSDAEVYAYYYGMNICNDSSTSSNRMISFELRVGSTDYLVFFARSDDNSTNISIEPKSKWEKISQIYNS